MLLRIKDEYVCFWYPYLMCYCFDHTSFVLSSCFFFANFLLMIPMGKNLSLTNKTHLMIENLVCGAHLLIFDLGPLMFLLPSQVFSCTWVTKKLLKKLYDLLKVIVRNPLVRSVLWDQIALFLNHPCLVDINE